MAKGGKGRGGQVMNIRPPVVVPKVPPGPPAPPAPPPPPRQNPLNVVRGEVNSLGPTPVDRERAEAMEHPDVGDQLTQEALLEYVRREVRVVHALWQRLETDAKAAQDLKARLQTEEDLLRQATGMLAGDRALLDAEKARLADASRAVADREAALDAKIIDLATREADALAGFAAQRHVAIERFEAAAAQVREDLVSRMERLAGAESDHLGRLESREFAHRERLEELYRTRETDIEDRQARLELDRRELLRERTEVDADRSMLSMQTAASEDKVKRESGYRMVEIEGQLAELNAKLEVVTASRDLYAQKVRDREDADRRMGVQSVTDLVRENEDLRRQIAARDDELRDRPSTTHFERMDELETTVGELEIQNSGLKREVAGASKRLADLRIASVDLETLRDEKLALDARNAVLKRTVEELNEQVNGRLEQNEGRSAFPRLTEMDTDPRLQTQVTTDRVPGLRSFCEEMRNRMAYDQDPKRRLFYSARDVRAFVAGLAMSRLHLLQGVSGTGKTSLPRAFARALNAGMDNQGFKLIEVQAGWRDREDLIGNYNTFEKKFYEREFLAALYEAQCVTFTDRPYFIVLDEMNLSHPEQYFADLLSAMEMPENLRSLRIMTARIPVGAPGLFRDGMTLTIPPNVWFIGTANRDETTKDFADKTYDRAHVMELPKRRDEFTPTAHSKAIFSYVSLVQEFESAQDKHRQVTDKAYNEMDVELGSFLETRFRVGWGNRLLRQTLSYAPVVIESGGSLTEAMDHLIATKLLRKVTGRFEFSLKDFEDLKSQIERLWLRIDPSGIPDRSFAAIKAECNRLVSGG